MKSKSRLNYCKASVLSRQLNCKKLCKESSNGQVELLLAKNGPIAFFQGLKCYQTDYKFHNFYIINLSVVGQVIKSKSRPNNRFIKARVYHHEIKINI